MPGHYLAGSRVLAALGQECLTSVHVNNGGRERTIACDRLACGFGTVANIELAMLLGCRIEHDAVAVDRGNKPARRIFCCRGVYRHRRQ